MPKEIDGNLEQLSRTVSKCERAIKTCPPSAEKDVAEYMLHHAGYAVSNISMMVHRNDWWSKFLYGLLFFAGLCLGSML